MVVIEALVFVPKVLSTDDVIAVPVDNDASVALDVCRLVDEEDELVGFLEVVNADDPF